MNLRTGIIYSLTLPLFIMLMFKTCLKMCCLDICPVSDNPTLLNDSDFLKPNPVPGQQVQSREVFASWCEAHFQIISAWIYKHICLTFLLKLPLQPAAHVLCGSPLLFVQDVPQVTQTPSSCTAWPGSLAFVLNQTSGPHHYIQLLLIIPVFGILFYSALGVLSGAF